MLSGNQHGSKGNQMAAATLSARRKKAKKALRREGKTDSSSITNITTSNISNSRRIEKDNAIRQVSKAAAATTHTSFTSDAPEKSISAMTDEERSQLIKSMGENIDTRLQEIQDNDLAELDRDAKEEMQQKLLEEVRLAAGTEQRLISSSIKKYITTYSTLPLQQQYQLEQQEHQEMHSQLHQVKEIVASEQVLEREIETNPLNGLPCVKVRHNSNSITALACLGGELVAFGDKTGHVYMVNVTVPSLIDHASLPTMTEADSITATNKSVHANQTSDDAYSGIRDDKRNNHHNHLSSDAKLSLHVNGQGRRKVLLEPTLPSSVLSMAMSDTRHYRPSAREMFEKTNLDTSCVSYLAVGTSDGSIGIWETLTLHFKGLLTMHHKAVTGLAFRLNTPTLYSVSCDKMLRVWSIPSMLCNDRLFGHESNINGLSALRREVAASVGDDGTMRLWKIDAATQQSYEYMLHYRDEALQAMEQRARANLHNIGLTNNDDYSNSTSNHKEYSVGGANGESTSELNPSALAASLLAKSRKDKTVLALEAVCMLTDTIVIVGGVDGTLLIFDINRRKPVITVPAAHGYGCVGDGTGLEHISSVALSHSTNASYAASSTENNNISSSIVKKLQSESTAEEEKSANSLKNATGSTSSSSLNLPSAETSSLPSSSSPLQQSTTLPTQFNQVSSVLSANTLSRHRQNANPITALAAVPYTDIFASGSYDGVVRLWHFATKSNTHHNTRESNSEEQIRQPFSLLCSLPVHGIVNSLSFSPSGSHLFIGLAKEPRRGRWIVMKRALNSVLIVPLQVSAAVKSGVPLSAQLNSATSTRGNLIPHASSTNNTSTNTIEHIPGELYGFDDNDHHHNNDDDDDDDKESAKSSSDEQDAMAASSDNMLIQDANGRLVFRNDILQQINLSTNKTNDYYNKARTQQRYLEKTGKTNKYNKENKEITSSTLSADKSTNHSDVERISNNSSATSNSKINKVKSQKSKKKMNKTKITSTNTTMLKKAGTKKLGTKVVKDKLTKKKKKNTMH